LTFIPLCKKKKKVASVGLHERGDDITRYHMAGLTKKLDLVFKTPTVIVGGRRPIGSTVAMPFFDKPVLKEDNKGCCSTDPLKST
jgi:hypothetical protein